jgi:hypothetical protein
MPPDQIIIIRHAQKPTKKPKHDGIREDGTHDPESLIVRGWQHAGALASIFAMPGNQPPDARFARPSVIFAAGVGKKEQTIAGKKVKVGSHSRRPLETITPMAERLGVKPVTTFTKGEETLLVKDVLVRAGTILICWQHEDIATIGNLIVGNDTTVPQTWPENRYDLIWVFDRAGDHWKFRQFFHERLMPS